MTRKKILILTEGFGSGHNQAAHALSVMMEQSNENITTHTLELGKILNPRLVPLLITAYEKTVNNHPRLFDRIYRFKHQKSPDRFSQLALHKLLYAQTEEVILDEKPDVIVCTHPFPNIVVSRLKRNGLHIPLFTVITDYDVHGTWISHEVNKYFVSTPAVKNKLMNHGIPSSLVEVTGIPVHPSFKQHHDVKEIRQQFGLKALPTVLIMGGGFGALGNIEKYYEMTAWKEKIQLIFCLGSNEKLRQKLSNDVEFRHENIKLLGFTKEIGKLMEVSDLLITKPGGMTCSEGLAREIPMLFFETVHGQEEKNLTYFISEGLADKIQSRDTIDLWFRRLIDNYSFIQERKRFIQQKNREYSLSDFKQTMIRSLYSQSS